MNVPLPERRDIEHLVSQEASCSSVAEDLSTGRYSRRQLLHYFLVNTTLNAMFPVAERDGTRDDTNGISYLEKHQHWFEERQAALSRAAQTASLHYQENVCTLLRDYLVVRAVRKTCNETMQPVHNPEGQWYQDH